MRDDAPHSLPSDALDADRDGPFASDAGVLLWAEEVSREMAWTPEFYPKSGSVVFFPRVAAKTADHATERVESELHVMFPFRERPLQARLVVPAGTLPLDFRNLRQKLYDPTGALEISTLLEGLPDSFRLGVPGELQALAVVSSPDALRSTAQEAFERGLALELAWSSDLEESIDPAKPGADAAAVADALVALATVGELFAWSEENAYVNPQAPAQAEQPSKRSGLAGLEKRPQKAREPRQKSSAEPRATAPVEQPLLPTRAPLPFPRTPLRSSSSSSTPAEVPRELAAGVRVQVAGGSFLGRLGVVQSVDAAKGQTRVLFGLLAATIASSDLVVVSAPGKRPRLSSSHRRLPPSKE